MVQTRTQRLREGELCPSLSQGGRGPFQGAACHTELVPWVLRSDQSGAPSRLKRERGSPKPAPALDWKTPQTVSAHQPQCHHVPDNWKGALDQLSWWVQPCSPPGKAKRPRGITGLKKPDSCSLSPVRRGSLPSGCRAVECDSVVASVPTKKAPREASGKMVGLSPWWGRRRQLCRVAPSTLPPTKQASA